MTLILAFAAACVFMVLAMVQFTVAIVAEPPKGAPVARWGMAYAASWAVIAAVIGRAGVETHATMRQTLAVATLIVGGWCGFHAFWIWLWIAIARSNAVSTGAPAIAPARVSLGRWCGRAAGAGLAGVLLAMAELGYVRSALAAIAATRHPLLAGAMFVGGAGGMLLIVGGMMLALGRGQSMSRAEIDEDLRRRKFGPRGRLGPLRAAASTYHHRGPAAGRRAELDVSLSAMKQAWQSGDWRRDATWRTIFTMATGAAMMTVGGFGAAVVAAPMPVNVICGGALGYVAFQVISAVHRA